MPLKRREADSTGTAGMVPVAIYTRVSTDNQIGGRFDSCESQAAICRDHIRKHAGEGWHEVACYTDAAYSGSSLNRPGIQALKRQIEEGTVKVVLIFKLERVLRSTDEWIPFRGFLLKYGCRLESATEDLSESTPSGRLKNNLLMSVAEYERLNTAEKTRAKMHEQAKRGLWNGGMVPFGYAYDSKTQTLHPHSEEAPVVRRIFDLSAKLVTLTEIANTLNAEGLRTKGREFRRRDGQVEQVGAQLFRSDGLRLIIGNPLYRGAVRFAGKEYAAKHDPLVTTELWEKANAAASPTLPRPGPRFTNRDTHEHLLKGLAHCGSCNRALVPTDATKKAGAEKVYRYYACSSILRQRAASDCPVGRVSADALERVVVSFLAEVGKHHTVAAAAIQHSETLKSKERPALVAELAGIQSKLDAVAKKFKNCIRAVEAGGTDVFGEGLRERAAELRAGKDRLLVQREQKRQQVEACDVTQLTEKRIVDALNRIGEILPKMDAASRREFVHLFVERVEVRKRLQRTRAGEPVEPARTTEVKIRLHVPRLVEAMDEKPLAETRVQRTALAARGVVFESKVDFTRAHRGEVTIIAPFTNIVRFGSVARPAPKPAPAPTEKEHAIHRARKWQRMLEIGAVANRVALAARENITPAAVTRILRLNEVLPEIQDYLANLKARNPGKLFPLKVVGRLAGLPPDRQRAAFKRMQQRFAVGVS